MELQHCPRCRQHNFFFNSEGKFVGIYQCGRFVDFTSEDLETSSLVLASKFIKLLEQGFYVIPESILKDVEACLILLYRLRYLRDDLLAGRRDVDNALKLLCRVDAIVFPTFHETFH